MADIFDYLRWRGDIPFDADPFNEVDNLILAELSYTSFDGIVDAGSGKKSLKEACERYFEIHSRDDIKEDSSHIRRAPLLMDGMLSGKRFDSVVLTHYVDIVSTDKDMQIAALTYLLPDGSAYIAFRGTDDTIVGWKEDFNMSYLPETEGQRSAVRYLNEAGKRTRGPLRVGGHSKGGNFAVYAAAFCDRAVQDRVTDVYTSDGPGFRSAVMKSEGYKRILPRVTGIVPDTSIIGMLLTSRVKHVTVKSSKRGWAQHDPMTWQIERNRFEQAEQSALGLFISESQREWLSGLDDESRESFVNTLFTMLEATGVDTFEEMKGKKLKALERMRSSINGMPKEKQDEFMEIIGALLQSGRRVARNTLTQSLNKERDDERK